MIFGEDKQTSAFYIRNADKAGTKTGLIAPNGDSSIPLDILAR
jgi:hypothetical protein